MLIGVYPGDSLDISYLERIGKEKRILITIKTHKLEYLGTYGKRSTIIPIKLILQETVERKKKEIMAKEFANMFQYNSGTLQSCGLLFGTDRHHN